MLKIYHCVFNVDVTMAFLLRRNAVQTERVDLNFMGQEFCYVKTDYLYVCL